MNISKLRSLVGTGTSIAALCAATAAFAQSAPVSQNGSDGDAGSPAEIVVTAQKRSESALKVPVAVTALSSESLVRENLVRLSDFATRVPGLNVTGARLSDVSIRGVSGNNGTSPTVSFTIDDVPFGPSSWAGLGNFPDLDPADIQRVEVLRGPQGTLYGASSLGGLIKFVTRQADPDEFSGRIEGTLNGATGGADGNALRGAVNVPLVAGKLGVRASAFRRHDPNVVDMYSPAGVLLDKNAGSNTVQGFRGSVFASPIDAVKINVSHLDQTTKSRNLNLLTPVNPYPTSFKPLFGYFGTDATASTGKVNVRLTQVHTDIDLGVAVLTSASGWGYLRNRTNSDVSRNLRFVYAGIPGFAPAVFPAAPADSVVRIDNDTATRKFSQEVRLASSGDGPVQWLVGGFYTNERSAIDQEIYGTDSSGTKLGSIYVNSTPSRFKEYAAFADVTYKFTERFDVQGGLRYSENKQSYQTRNTVNPAAVPFFGSSTVPVPTRSKDSSVTWLVTPRFKIDEDVMVFLRVASGYRPGGPNSSSTAPQQTFDPDRVINSELGVKGRFLDRKLTVEASLFNIDWKDIQLQASTLAGLPYFSNGGRARSRGLEAAVQVSPGSGWEFTGNMTVADAELRENLPVTAGNHLLGKRGDPLPFAAKFTSNLGVDKNWEFANGMRASVGFNYNHVGRRNSTFRSSGAPLARRGQVNLPAYDVLDLRASIGIDQWNLALFMRNATNERGVANASDNGGISAATQATFIQPRTTGATLSYSF